MRVKVSDYIIGQAVAAVEMGFKDPHFAIPENGVLRKIPITKGMMDDWKKRNRVESNCRGFLGYKNVGKV